MKRWIDAIVALATDRRAAFLLLAVSLVLVVGPARASQSILQGLKYDGGFQELVISVPDLEEAIEFYQRVAGWRVIERGAAQPEMLQAWALPDSVKAIEAVLQDPRNPNGFIRLIKFRGTAQQEARPSGHPWEPGGVAGFVVTTKDVQAKYTQFRQGGWHGYSQPVQVKGENGGRMEVMMQGFADEVVAIAQPTAPRPKGEKSTDVSAADIAFATVADLDATVAFYSEKLGFKVFKRDEGPTSDPGANLLGLPNNLVNNVYQRTAFVHPQGDDPANPHKGALVFTTYYGAQGNDFSARAHAPNLGVIAIRFAVSDIDARVEGLKAKGVMPLYEPTDVGMAPYGAVQAFGIRDPNGILIEFFEPRDKP